MKTPQPALKAVASPEEGDLAAARRVLTVASEALASLAGALDGSFSAAVAAMLAAGAVQEVQALAAQGLDPALPAMRAHGVPELLAHLSGGMTLVAAEQRAVLHTGQYTKRQATWFRHHRLAPPGAAHIIHARIGDRAQFQESRIAEIFAFIENWR